MWKLALVQKHTDCSTQAASPASRVAPGNSLRWQKPNNKTIASAWSVCIEIMSAVFLVDIGSPARKDALEMRLHRADRVLACIVDQRRGQAHWICGGICCCIHVSRRAVFKDARLACAPIAAFACLRQGTAAQSTRGSSVRERQIAGQVQDWGVGQLVNDTACALPVRLRGPFDPVQSPRHALRAQMYSM